MTEKVEIVNKRGSSAFVDPDRLDLWLADKKEGWTVVEKAPAEEAGSDQDV